jgi:hypothetical protein
VFGTDGVEDSVLLAGADVGVLNGADVIFGVFPSDSVGGACCAGDTAAGSARSGMGEGERPDLFAGVISGLGLGERLRTTAPRRLASTKGGDT